MIYTMYVIADISPVTKYYWGPNGWTLDLANAFYFKNEETAVACVNDDEIIDSVIELVELD